MLPNDSRLDHFYYNQCALLAILVCDTNWASKYAWHKQNSKHGERNTCWHLDDDTKDSPPSLLILHTDWLPSLKIFNAKAKCLKNLSVASNRVYWQSNHVWARQQKQMISLPCYMSSVMAFPVVFAGCACFTMPQQSKASVTQSFTACRHRLLYSHGRERDIQPAVSGQ
jgi:hypothetical protein